MGEEKKEFCEDCTVGIYYDFEDTCLVNKSTYERAKSGESMVVDTLVCKFKFCPHCGRRIDWKNEFGEEFEE